MKCAPSIIPVVDLFAGPGGLGEGFSAYVGKYSGHPFRPVLSIEKDEHAQETLELRCFFRQFRHNNKSVPDEYYAHIAGDLDRQALFSAFPKQSEAASQEALLIELGGKKKQDSAEAVDSHIRRALGDSHLWVLLGGPPCQAYSGAGRSRILGAEKRKLLNGRDPGKLSDSELEEVEKAANRKFSKDPRHILYREYLRIIARHAPPVFVMENVKGILSSKKDGKPIFPKILRDMRHPYGVARKYWPKRLFADTRYRLFSFVTGSEPSDVAKTDFLIRAEEFGVPQARHRVIILGLRTDLFPEKLTIPSLNEILPSYKNSTIKDVIGSLPKLRSGISKSENTEERWIEILQEAISSEWIQSVDPEVRRVIRSAVAAATKKPPPYAISRSGFYMRRNDLRSWFCDSRLSILPNSESTRTHMPSDILRYLFIAAFGTVHKRSPKLADFPLALLPNHQNISHHDLKNADFADRFRVQRWYSPSTTITCHISKDGHYFIHPDPSQCRSLTVREAARLQTFPDNYFFCGKQTHQYTQVGNAVPPLLATQLAAVVDAVLRSAK